MMISDSPPAQHWQCNRWSRTCRRCWGWRAPWRRRTRRSRPPPPHAPSGHRRAACSYHSWWRTLLILLIPSFFNQDPVYPHKRGLAAIPKGRIGKLVLVSITSLCFCSPLTHSRLNSSAMICPGKKRVSQVVEWTDAWVEQVDRGLTRSNPILIQINCSCL